MSRLCTISVNGARFAAYPGDRILDAALLAGFEMPHDCRAGKCGTCVVRVVGGDVLGGESGATGCVHACQAVVLSSLELESDSLAAAGEIDAEVTAITALSHDVAEVTVTTRDRFAWQPGQYVHATFEGFPSRAFSPTVALDGRDRLGSFRLHIKRLRKGRVSGAIGDGIRVGHKLTLNGPFGSAFLRPGLTNRLVLFSGGTGFAPIWAIADTALRENASRSIVVVAGVKNIDRLYMAQALERMARCPNAAILPVTADAQDVTTLIHTGWPTDFGGIIAPGDTVHAAGAPEMVKTIGTYAAAADAQFYADPFTPAAATNDRSGLARLTERIGRTARPWRRKESTGKPALAPRAP